jgi:2-oxoglutarate ferredoxin oxidoreductase subunit alpha
LRGAVLTGAHFMNGDIAAAEGAIAAGCRFFAGYPITPATEVTERMAERLPEVNGRYIQMEDEIGSMAAILGASVAGMKSMTATSGPGFSLMMENIGLGAMMEIPCVVFDVQRGGPSTGLPTLVAQQDMMQARWGSHGDYALVAYCPNSPQEMFNLAIQAFNTAEKYRIPTLVMADESIGHMTEKVVIPEQGAIQLVGRKKPSVPPEQYIPFKADDDLIPPMALAGEGYSVRMTGLTHDEHGRPSINLDAQTKLIPRLAEKIRKHASDIIKYEELHMDDADVVVVAYGITSRCVRRSVELARKDGVKAGLFRLITAWPFPEKKMKELASRVKAFVVPEINLGQMVLEVERAVAGRVPVKSVTYHGGGLPNPELTYEMIIEVAK